MSEIKILDACCGSRLFWFDKNEQHTTFMDIRQDTFDTDYLYEIKEFAHKCTRKEAEQFP